MPYTPTRTWTLDAIARAVDAACRDAVCPRCPPMDAPWVVSATGPWTLSVGLADVAVTCEAACHGRFGHVFPVTASLWRKAKTPYGSMRVKKAALRVPGAPRPLRSI